MCWLSMCGGRHCCKQYFIVPVPHRTSAYDNKHGVNLISCIFRRNASADQGFPKREMRYQKSIFF